MDRVHLSPSGEEELLRLALDDEPVSTELKQHLEECQECQQKIAAYRDAANFLEAHLYRLECPSGMQLSLYCVDMLPVEERTQVAAHLLQCPLCADEVAVTRRFNQDVEILSASSPPFPVRRLFARRLKAQPALALRHAGEAPEWPHQYRAEPLHLSLHLSRTRNGAHSLIGIVQSVDQAIYTDDFRGGTAALYPSVDRAVPDAESLAGTTPLRRVEIDDLGNFVLNAVPPGTYVLLICVSDFELIVEDLLLAYG